MMLHISTQQLIRKLCELTEAGSINWKEGEGQCSVFETEGYVVEIQPAPLVRLLRADGHELERVDAADLAMPWAEGEGTFATRVTDMAHRANRIARGAEIAIAKILSTLSAPPKARPEPEPEPAALAFSAPIDKPPQSVQASESAAAIAAVNADLESQRRHAAEPPPASHSVPKLPEVVAIPESETAIDRVLAVQPLALSAPLPDEPVEAPGPVPSVVTDTPPSPAEVATQTLLDPIAATPVATAPAAFTPTAKPGFGSIDSFSRPMPAASPQAKPAPTPEPVKIISSGMLMSGISAHSRQTVESSTMRDFLRPASSLAGTPSAPSPEKQLEPAAAGPNIYKPWT
jgi:hypothetical protein